ncbi:MAG: hypothetical protein HQK58_17980 [Deltaproteobacteria bacterium]|nr:hypothetical protein [Deltaproteobacteria bacterium]
MDEQISPENHPGRLISQWDRQVPVDLGLAVDDMLALSVAETNSPPILHLYTFEPAAIVGRYQDIESALKLDRCRARGVAYSRRSTGGGTVIMGPTVLALGFGASLNHPKFAGGIKTIFHTLSRVIIRALDQLGVAVTFRPKNDLEVAGKKLAGLSASMEIPSAFLFHMSLLVDFDIELMLDIMNLAPVKLYDKGYSCFSQRVTTINRETGHQAPISLVAHEVRTAFEQELGFPFEDSAMTAWEESTVDKLRVSRYHQHDWIFSKKSMRSRMGHAYLKTPGGLLEIFLSLAGKSIESVIITGDFFSTTADINRIETALKWTAADKQSIIKNLEPVWQDDIIHQVSADMLAEAIGQARDSILTPM